jgi:hypothetical protein
MPAAVQRSAISPAISFLTRASGSGAGRRERAVLLVRRVLHSELERLAVRRNESAGNGRVQLGTREQAVVHRLQVDRDDARDALGNTRDVVRVIVIGSESRKRAAPAFTTAISGRCRAIASSTSSAQTVSPAR